MKYLFMLLLICSVGVGQTEKFYISDHPVLKIKTVYVKDTNGVFTYHKEVIDEIISENWKMEFENDSLKRNNFYLKKMLRIYIEISIEMNKAFLKSGLADSTIIKRSMKIDKETLNEIR